MLEAMRTAERVEAARTPVLEPAGVLLRRDTARFLACDAELLTVIEDPTSGDPLHVGPNRRTINRQLRRAMVLRDRTCTWPGCVATRVYAHHRHHRAAGGADDLESLTALCLVHHRLVHEHHLTLIRDPATGQVRFYRPDGTEITAEPPNTPGLSPPPPADQAPKILFDRHVDSGADPLQPARRCRWEGDPLRLIDAIDVIVTRRAAALARTQPT